MPPFDLAASPAPTGYTLTALDLLLTPVPSAITLDPGKGLFSSQGADFQSSLSSAEKKWSPDPPPRKAQLKPDSHPGPQYPAASAEPPTHNPPPAQTAESVQAAAAPAQGSGAAPPHRDSAPGAGPAASGEPGRVGAIGPGSRGALEGPPAPASAGQPLGAKGAISPAAQGAPGAEIAASQEKILKQGLGASEKSAPVEAGPGPASPSGKAGSLANSAARTSGSESDLHPALNGSSEKLAKGAMGNTPSHGRMSANLAARFANAPTAGPGAFSGGAAASLLETAGRPEGPATASAQLGASPMKGGAASLTPPLASPPVGASSLAASGKIGGIATLDSAAAAKSSPALRADLIQQVVRSAALMVRNGRPEIRLDLKPESLGSIKLYVSTVNHQVQVKIVAPTQMVKEILEGSLSQLKFDLLTHKLDVERFDVTVAGDPDRGFADPKSWAGAQRERNSSAPGQQDAQDATAEDPHEHPHHPHPMTPSPGRVDYFV